MQQHHKQCVQPLFMNNTLHKLSILVTRPAQQAEPLIAKLEQQGALVFHQPTIDIEAHKVKTQQTIIENIQTYDWLIFISKNAVEYGLRLIEDTHKLKNTHNIAAIGKATFQALSDRGFTSITSPASGFDSEALLNLTAFAANNIENKKILIIRGGEGREHLKNELSIRNASVTYLDVYCRKPAKPILSKQVFNKIDVITISSQQGLENLYTMLNVITDKSFLDKILVVPSQRCYNKAVELGFKQIESAANATDDAMLNCIIDTIGHKKNNTNNGLIKK